MVGGWRFQAPNVQTFGGASTSLHSRSVRSVDASKAGFFFITPFNINTLNPKMEVWKMIFLFKHVIFRFHDNFAGCIPNGDHSIYLNKFIINKAFHLPILVVFYIKGFCRQQGSILTKKSHSSSCNTNSCR